MKALAGTYNSDVPTHSAGGRRSLNHSDMIFNSVNMVISPLPRPPSPGRYHQNEKYFSGNILSHRDFPVNKEGIMTPRQKLGDYVITNISSNAERKRESRMYTLISPYNMSPITGNTDYNNKNNRCDPCHDDHLNTSLYKCQIMDKPVNPVCRPNNNTLRPIGGRNAIESDDSDRPLWLQLLLRKGDHPNQDGAVLCREITSSDDRYHPTTVVKDVGCGSSPIYRHSHELYASSRYNNRGVMDHKRRLQVLRARISSRRALNRFRNKVTGINDTDAVDEANVNLFDVDREGTSLSIQSGYDVWNDNDPKPKAESNIVDVQEGKPVDSTQTWGRGEVIYRPPRVQPYTRSQSNVKTHSTSVSIINHSYSQVASDTCDSNAHYIRPYSHIKSPVLLPISSTEPTLTGSSYCTNDTSDGLTRRHRLMLDEMYIHSIPHRDFTDVCTDANEGGWILGNPVMGLDLPFEDYLLENYGGVIDNTVPNTTDYSEGTDSLHCPLEYMKTDDGDIGDVDIQKNGKVAVPHSDAIEDSLMTQQLPVVPLLTTVSILNTAIARNQQVLDDISDVDYGPRLHSTVLPTPIPNCPFVAYVPEGDVVIDPLDYDESHSELREETSSVSKEVYDEIDEDVAKVMMMMDII